MGSSQAAKTLSPRAVRKVQMAWAFMNGRIYTSALSACVDTIASLMCVCKASKTLTYWQPALCMATVRSLNTRNICPLEAVGSTCSSSVIFLRRIYPLEQVESRAPGVNLQYQACLVCSLSASVQCWLHVCPQCNPQTSRASGSLLTGDYPKNNDPSEKHTLIPYTEPHLPEL